MLLGCSGSFDFSRIFPQEEGLAEISKWGLQKVVKVSCIKITNMFVCDYLLETEVSRYVEMLQYVILAPIQDKTVISWHACQLSCKIFYFSNWSPFDWN